MVISRWRLTRRARREGGMNLVEILIAMAIFSIGILQVMAMFPTAVMSGAEAVRSTQATVLGRAALAELEYQLRAPLYTGPVVAHGGNVISAAPAPAWSDDVWKAHFATLTSRLDSNSKIQSVYISANDNNTLTYAGAFDQPPQPGDRLRINRYALPPVPAAALSRVCKSAGLDPVNKNVVKVETVNWDTAVDPAAGRYFLIVAGGRATRKVYRVTALDAAAKAVTCANADFVADALAVGDSFFLAGSPEFDKWQPTPNFGIAQTKPPTRTGPPQTLPALVFRGNPAAAPNYSFAILISDTKDFSAPNEDLVRVDVLVYFRYNDEQPPENNQRAVGHYVRFMGRR